MHYFRDRDEAARSRVLYGLLFESDLSKEKAVKVCFNLLMHL